jgi:lipoprotein-releasing system ATP-binding protein
MLTGKNIYKRYGSLEVLRGVNLEISKGEVVAIVGPSGCGKSTLLHILGSLDKADMGEIVINNTGLSLLSGNKLAAFRNKHIGFVFQFHHYCLSSHWKMYVFRAGWPEEIKMR